MLVDCLCQPCGGLQPEAIRTILAAVPPVQPTCGITGILCYGGGIFLQAIEGGRMAVSELYGHIQRDVRHKDVVLLHYEEILERRFGGWTMGQVNVARINQSILLKYAEKARTGPYAVSGKVSLALLGRIDGHGLDHWQSMNAGSPTVTHPV